jgi:hypothetical protein
MAPAAAAFEIESAEGTETATALKRGPDYDDKMKTVTKKYPQSIAGTSPFDKPRALTTDLPSDPVPSATKTQRVTSGATAQQ